MLGAVGVDKFALDFSERMVLKLCLMVAVKSLKEFITFYGLADNFGG